MTVELSVCEIHLPLKRMWDSTGGRLLCGRWVLTAMGGDNAVPQHGHCGYINSTTWGHPDCQPKCKQGCRTHVPPGVYKASRLSMCFKIVYRPSSSSKTSIWESESPGVAHVFPRRRKRTESTHVEHSLFHRHSPITSHQARGLGSSKRDTEMTESQCLALEIRQGHLLKNQCT